MKLNGIKITWLGHATFRIETPGGKTVLIDPWVMGNPKCPEKEKNFESGRHALHPRPRRPHRRCGRNREEAQSDGGGDT